MGSGSVAVGAGRQAGSETAPARKADPAPTQNHSGPGRLLDLQRKAGNRATVALMRRTDPQPAASTPAIRRKVTAVSQLRPATRQELGAEPLVETPVTAAELAVDEVHIPGGIRPPTRVANSQGRHTVAWAARVREWAAAFRGPLPAVLQEIARRATDDKRLSDTPEYETVTQRLQTLGSSPARPESEWIRSLSELITAYIVAYQRSEFAVFPSTNPKGKGEADRIKKLGEWSQLQPTEIDKYQVLEAARFLLDTHGSMRNDVRHKVVSDWLRMLQTVWPAFFRGVLSPPAAPVLDSVKRLGVAGQRLVERALVGEDVDSQLAVALAGIEADKMVDEDDATPSSNEDSTMSDTDPDLEESRAEAQEQDEAAEEGRNVDARFGTRSYVVGVKLTPGATSSDTSPAVPQVPARALRVDRLDIANERANTKFGKKQQNHVTPWSVERVYWSKRFADKSLEVSLDILAARASGLGLTLEAPPQTATVGQWSAILDRRVEAVIAAEQASESATFIAEPDRQGKSTATGHGESPALMWLSELEGSDPGRSESMDLDKEVRARFRALIDLPQLDSTRKDMGLDSSKAVEDLRRDWQTKMNALFPKVCAAYPTELTKAFDEAEQPTEHFLVANETKRLEGHIAELEKAAGADPKQRRSSRIRLAETGGVSQELAQARADMQVLMQWLGFSEDGHRAAVRKAQELRDGRKPVTDKTRKVDDYESDTKDQTGSSKRVKDKE